MKTKLDKDEIKYLEDYQSETKTKIIGTIIKTVLIFGALSFLPASFMGRRGMGNNTITDVIGWHYWLLTILVMLTIFILIIFEERRPKGVKRDLNDRNKHLAEYTVKEVIKIDGIVNILFEEDKKIILKIRSTKLKKGDRVKMAIYEHSKKVIKFNLV